MKQSFCKSTTDLRKQCAGTELGEGWIQTSMSSVLSFPVVQFPISVFSAVMDNAITGLTLLLPCTLITSWHPSPQHMGPLPYVEIGSLQRQLFLKDIITWALLSYEKCTHKNKEFGYSHIQGECHGRGEGGWGTAPQAENASKPLETKGKACSRSASTAPRRNQEPS